MQPKQHDAASYPATTLRHTRRISDRKNLTSATQNATPQLREAPSGQNPKANSATMLRPMRPLPDTEKFISATTVAAPTYKIPRPWPHLQLQVLRPRAANSRPLEPSYSKPMLNPRATCDNLFLDSMRRRPKRG